MNKKGLGHGLLMVLCCLIPLVLIGAVSKFGFSSVLSYGMLLLCPLMHIFMMRGMHGGHGNEDGYHGHSSHSQNEPEKGEKLKELKENA